METILLNTKNSKTNEPHRFRLNLNLKYHNKNMELDNLSVYYTRKSIKSACSNN